MKLVTCSKSDQKKITKVMCQNFVCRTLVIPLDKVLQNELLETLLLKLVTIYRQLRIVFS